MKRNNNLLAIRRQMAANGGNFAHFGGNDYDNPLLEQRAGYAGMAGAGAAVQAVKGQAGTINLKIQNTDEVNDLYVTLFGTNEGLLEAFNGTDDHLGNTAGAAKGLIVTVNGQSHEKFKRRLVHKPALIEGLRVIYPTDSQLAEEWELVYDDNNSQKIERYYPSGHVNAGQQQSRQVDDRTFNMVMNADSSIRFKVEKAPSATAPTIITMVLNIRAITDSVELLEGKSPLGVSKSQLGGNDLY